MLQGRCTAQKPAIAAGFINAGVSPTYHGSIDGCSLTGTQLLFSGYCKACRPG